MKKFVHMVLLSGLFSLLISCAGGGGGVSVGVYHHHHGFGPWWGSRTYYRDRVIVVPPEEIEPPLEATPLPSELDDMPDIGMPDIDVGGFGD